MYYLEQTRIEGDTNDQLKRKAISLLGKIQKLPKRIMKYFNHPKTTYAGVTI